MSIQGSSTFHACTLLSSATEGYRHSLLQCVLAADTLTVSLDSPTLCSDNQQRVDGVFSPQISKKNISWLPIDLYLHHAKRGGMTHQTNRSMSHAAEHTAAIETSSTTVLHCPLFTSHHNVTATTPVIEPWSRTSAR